MSDYVVNPGADDDVSSVASKWWLFLVMGAAAVVIGMVLVLDLVVAVRTLAFFVAFGLIFNGIGEVLASDRYRSPFSMVAGALLIASGIVAMAWPGITLWVLAVIVAMGLLISGGLRIAAAVMDNPDGAGWILAGGILSVVAGVLAFAWPGATVLVLAILLGVRLILFGAVEIAWGLKLRELR